MCTRYRLSCACRGPGAASSSPSSSAPLQGGQPARFRPGVEPAGALAQQHLVLTALGAVHAVALWGLVDHAVTAAWVPHQYLLSDEQSAHRRPAASRGAGPTCTPGGVDQELLPCPLEFPPTPVAVAGEAWGQAAPTRAPPGSAGLTGDTRPGCLVLGCRQGSGSCWPGKSRSQAQGRGSRGAARLALEVGPPTTSTVTR